jgi:hypothetical protein
MQGAIPHVDYEDGAIYLGGGEFGSGDGTYVDVGRAMWSAHEERFIILGDITGLTYQACYPPYLDEEDSLFIPIKKL